MPESVRLPNRGQLRKPVVAGVLFLFMGVALVALTLLLPDVFALLKSETAMQIAGGAVGLLGALVLGFALARFPLSVEFGDQVRVRWAFSEWFVEWADVGSLELVTVSENVRPLAPLGGMPGPLGLVVHATGAGRLGRFDIATRHIRVRLKDSRTFRCDARRLEWEHVAKLAAAHAVPVSEA